MSLDEMLDILRDEYSKIKKERDAAIADIEKLIHEHCTMNVCELCDLNPRDDTRCKNLVHKLTGKEYK